MEVVAWNRQKVVVPSVLREVDCVVFGGRIDEHRFVGHARSHLYHGDGGRAPRVLARVNIVPAHINAHNTEERGGDTSHGCWRKRFDRTDIEEKRGRDTSDGCRRKRFSHRENVD